MGWGRQAVWTTRELSVHHPSAPQFLLLYFVSILNCKHFACGPSPVKACITPFHHCEQFGVCEPSDFLCCPSQTQPILYM